ncbi:hypothetical protein PHLGIDRAFT_247662 [Phlebiopsis gigantea 11061_1 CR5-6]|uniref:Uncharacterized protein n=1 Tax=Phlebiopsis gigantea (strain 11061_1 CR5-6) TaxID=745531 RepID=A0A0C3NXX1_PHLG1|nr:hypothetical protein PHLGIDRAFT_247662 [Phlebiopsis gigantea 11061_1 CR5-6]
MLIDHISIIPGISAMTVVQCANILTFYVPSAILKGGLAAVTNSISVALMTRLMLSLYRSASHSSSCCASSAWSTHLELTTQLPGHYSDCSDFVSY